MYRSMQRALRPLATTAAAAAARSRPSAARTLATTAVRASSSSVPVGRMAFPFGYKVILPASTTPGDSVSPLSTAATSAAAAASVANAAATAASESVTLDTSDSDPSSSLDAAVAAESKPNLDWFVDPLPSDLSPVWMRNLTALNAEAGSPPAAVSEPGANPLLYGHEFSFGDTVTPADLASFLTDRGMCTSVTVLDVRGRSDVADAMVVASARSTAHMRAVTEDLYRHLKSAAAASAPTPADAQQAIAAIHVDGLDTDDWVVVDLGRVFVHIFTPEGRATYDLDRLWTQSPAETEAEIAAYLADEGPVGEDEWFFDEASEDVEGEVERA
ncbi:hypothetical protein H9P43_009615 [Blastocladiella emersonii ATCC 22665]|nr:hypothetical protein H9P43_009615 [Blastocladiella emersonii ATCC 22665]